MTDEQKAKCHEIADHYGEEHQMLKAVEEMAELTQAISKNLVTPNSEGAWSNYYEELTDVSIMIEQLCYLLEESGEYDDLEKCIERKLNRQLERMERERNG